MKAFIHRLADVQSENIGEDTKIWQFAVVLRGAKIGRNCNICANTFIESDVVVGDNVTVKCGVQLYDGLRVGNNVCFGPNATVTNDKYPRSRNSDWECRETVIEDGVSVGANATLLPGIRLGKGCMVGAGAVVTKDVAPGAIVVGNPARVLCHRSECKEQ